MLYRFRTSGSSRRPNHAGAGPNQSARYPSLFDERPRDARVRPIWPNERNATVAEHGQLIRPRITTQKRKGRRLVLGTSVNLYYPRGEAWTVLYRSQPGICEFSMAGQRCAELHPV